jgi:hypothetical protein
VKYDVTDYILDINTGFAKSAKSTDNYLYDLLNKKYSINSNPKQWNPISNLNSDEFKYPPNVDIQQGGSLKDDIQKYIIYDNVLKLYDCTNKKYFNKCLKFPIELSSITEYLKPKDAELKTKYPKCFNKI